MPDGSAERRARALMLRYAAWFRAVVSAACLVLGALVAPSAAAVALLLALAAWTVLHARLLVRRPAPVLITADLVLFCVAAVTQRWTVPDWAAANSTSWLLAVLTVTCVAMQWFTGVWTGALGVIAYLGAYLAGAFWAVGPAESGRLFMLLWLLPQGALSRACVMLLARAARRADTLAGGQEAERIAAAVNTARRADERDHLALLHDTVAATLLMVGAGTMSEPADWLAEQVGRDLAVLRQAAAPAPQDLASLLRQEISRSRLRVRYGSLPAVRVSPARAEAIAGSVREALTNVRRHAGVNEARLTVDLTPLRISVSDDGRGFEPVPSPHRRGITGSIIARTEAAGGRAVVRSRPGGGTVVVLEFGDG